ncbi:8530_t:CDS:2 [Entrophospora sp. SA101]|nr:8530_t:CDS:2 [Entrophospora sp. SA101]
MFLLEPDKTLAIKQLEADKLETLIIGKSLKPLCIGKIIMNSLGVVYRANEILEEIWKPRCEIMLINEHSAGIDRKQKHKKKPLNYVSTISNNHNILNDNLELGKRGILHLDLEASGWIL